ncbi:MAG: ThiF family adenylyltransferase [Syntrophobacteraceae bacterium]|jgi:molybdopterin/thiamine biosynthesis adenylyltransferase
MTEEVARAARIHLFRDDGQEDLCFALWYPSRGQHRTTALIQRLILPGEGDRNVHGNASFEPAYFERALTEAAGAHAGLALLHSHPGGRGWQGMSDDDINAEQGNAGAVLGATGFPFVGLTLAGDETWSGRFWEKTALRTYSRAWCANVRVVGDRLEMSYNEALTPRPQATDEQIRTVSAWGEDCQADLVRLRVGIVGAGSVGGMIAEALTRTGFEDIAMIDFDHIERHNLDRSQYATRADVGRIKVEVLAEHLRSHATSDRFTVNPVVAAVYEEEGFRAALDCDVLFSCVDRPWGRYVLNLIAYAHLIPVVDGGIAVRRNRFGELAMADWRAHTATIGRPCLQCLGQYDPGLVQMEREGHLDDPTYIVGLAKDHPLKIRENVFTFSMSCASLQMLQMLSLALAPLNRSNPGAQRYHFVGGFMEEAEFGSCHTECSFSRLIAHGDACGISVTGTRVKHHSSDTEQELSGPRWWHKMVSLPVSVFRGIRNAIARIR